MSATLYEISFPNGKKYIGITTRSLRQRWSGHLYSLTRSVTPVSHALRKYREGAIIRPLVVGDSDYIADLEIKAIEAFQTRDRRYGYNVGIGGTVGPMLGQTHTPEVRAVIGAASAARPRSIETKLKTSATLKGRVVTEETRRRISDGTRIGMALPEVRKKLSESLTGRKLSAEHCEKLKGRIRSQAANLAVSLALKGKPKSAAFAENLRSLKWWHCGQTEKRSQECPGSEWKAGRKGTI